MISQLYVRIRGRVQGPFDESKIRSMIQKGQLSRVHQVSEDGQNWVKASEIPDLFVSSQAAAPTAAHQADVGGQAHDASPPAETKEWYFGSGDQPVGPFPFSQIKEMVSSGKLATNDIVWKEGMSEWVKVSALPELANPGTNASVPTSNANPGSQMMHQPSANLVATGEIPIELIRSILSARPWILFFAITILVLGSLSDVGSIILLLQGFKLGSAKMFLQGVSSFVWGTVFIFAGIFLFGVTGKSYRLQFEQTHEMLTKIMISYQRFWLFVGITTIVMIAYVALVVFLVIGFPELFYY